MNRLGERRRCQILSNHCSYAEMTLNLHLSTRTHQVEPNKKNNMMAANNNNKKRNKKNDSMLVEFIISERCAGWLAWCWTRRVFLSSIHTDFRTGPTMERRERKKKQRKLVWPVFSSRDAASIVIFYSFFLCLFFDDDDWHFSSILASIFYFFYGY